MTRRGLVLFTMMSLIWGVPYLMIRISVAEITPATLVFFRTSIAALVLLPIAIVRVDLGPTVRRWRWVLTFAIVEISIPWIMLSSAEQQISSSLAALLIAGVPLTGTVIALATGSTERVSRSTVGGLLLGFAGVAAIVGGNISASGLVPLLQMALVVIGYSFGPAILARPLAGLPSVGVQGLAMGTAALIYLPISLATGWPTALPSAQVVASVVTLGLVCTAAAFVIFTALIDEVGAVRATVVTNVNPAVAAILGVLVLGEAFSLAMAIGLVLVVAGATVATRPTRAHRGVDRVLPSA